ncbi:MAG: GNAT family N-acetyltransferase [Ardenticatenales bacterium]
MRSLEDVVLTTERLRLRPLMPSDAASLYAVFSDAAVMRYWSTAPWTSDAAAHELIAKDVRAHADGAYVRLGIEVHSTGALIGTCTLFDLVPQCRRAEIGYALARAAWGNGYMHEALIALVAFGFRDLDLNRIEADIDPRNEASARSLERLGFVKEGHLRERWIVEGEVSDTGLYGLLRREWRLG